MSKITIGIIGGKGKMGAYFQSFFKDNGYEVIISDRSTDLSNIELARQADVVIVSVPIGSAAEVIAEVAPHVKKEGLLMDLTSLKVQQMKSMKSANASYFGCHPLFGPTNSIEGQMVILCKGKGEKWYQWWMDLLKKNKVDIHEMSAETHDDLMVYVQALSHFSDLVLADTLRASGMKINQFVKYQSPPYKLKLNMMGRILNQDPNLYAQIQIQNPNSLRVMNDFKKLTEVWIDLVKNKNTQHFEQRFKKISDYLGWYKEVAMEESNFLIEQMNRRRLADESASVAASILPDKKYDLATLGPEGSFSSLAARDYLPDSSVFYTPSIADVFDLIKKGKVKKGIVPIENKLTGSVTETAYQLFESDLPIQAEHTISIHHYLVSLSEVDPKKIKTIYSHAQPLQQCRKYLKDYFPTAALQSMPSTTAALKKLIADGDYSAAVICSKEAAESYKMHVIAENIEDYYFNETRFLVIGKEQAERKKEGKYKTSIAFYFSADALIRLYQVLGELNKAKVNMTKIESLANPEVPGGYVFYIDFEGSVDDPAIKKMLDNIKKLVKKVKVLGCY